MIRFTRKSEPKPDEAVAASMAKVAEVRDQVIARRRDLIETALRGCVAGGFCSDHHMEIVTIQSCGCEALFVKPFSVGFWTAIVVDMHGAPLPLSPPLEHDISMQGAYH